MSLPKKLNAILHLSDKVVELRDGEDLIEVEMCTNIENYYFIEKFGGETYEFCLFRPNDVEWKLHVFETVLTEDGAIESISNSQKEVKLQVSKD